MAEEKMLKSKSNFMTASSKDDYLSIRLYGIVVGQPTFVP